MILRRFMKHVTDQNWFAVGLDVIVVIVGIFLGMQVQAWNEERQERVQERLYLTNFHSEILDGLNFNEANMDGLILGEEFYKYDQYLDQLLMVFGGSDIDGVLDERHCAAIWGSHIYNDISIDIPTLRELTASGQLTIIKNQNIKFAISKFSFALDALRALVVNINPTAVIMARKYPELIQLDTKMRNIQRDTYNHQCQFEKMSTNKAFMNDIIDNGARMRAYTLTLKNQQDMLNLLHDELDIDLGIIH